MASRKVKHQRALEKREKFMQDLAYDGKKALEEAQERRAARKAIKEEQEFQDNLTKLVAMLSASLRRFPSDEEVTLFIQGDEQTRIDVLNHKYKKESNA